MVIIPSQTWLQISPSGGIDGYLCLSCIDERCYTAGIRCNAELMFAGKAVQAGSMAILNHAEAILDYKK